MWKVVSVLTVLFAGAVSAQQVADAVAPEAAGAGVFEDMGPEYAGAMAAKVQGKPVKNKEALANPEALTLYAGLEELQS